MQTGTWWVSGKHAWNRHRHWPDHAPCQDSYWRVIRLCIFIFSKYLFSKCIKFEKKAKLHPNFLRVVLQHCVIKTIFAWRLTQELLYAKRDKGRFVRRAACCTLNKQRTPQPRAVIPKITCIHFTALSEVCYEHLFYLNTAASTWY